MLSLNVVFDGAGKWKLDVFPGPRYIETRKRRMGERMQRTWELWQGVARIENWRVKFPSEYGGWLR